MTTQIDDKNPQKVLLIHARPIRSNKIAVVYEYPIV